MKHRPTIEEPRKVVLVFTDEEYDTDSLWELLQEYHDSEALLAASLADRSCAPHAADASTSASAEEKKRADGLIAGHAYSLIRVVETAAGFRLVKLRNPWGKSVRKLGMGVWGCTEHRGSCRAAARPCKWQSLQVASISARPLSEDLSAILTDHPHRSSSPIIPTGHPHRSSSPDADILTDATCAPCVAQATSSGLARGATQARCGSSIQLSRRSCGLTAVLEQTRRTARSGWISTASAPHSQTSSAATGRLDCTTLLSQSTATKACAGRPSPVARAALVFGAYAAAAGPCTLHTSRATARVLSREAAAATRPHACAACGLLW